MLSVLFKQKKELQSGFSSRQRLCSLLVTGLVLLARAQLVSRNAGENTFLVISTSAPGEELAGWALDFIAHVLCRICEEA